MRILICRSTSYYCYSNGTSCGDDKAHGLSCADAYSGTGNEACTDGTCDVNETCNRAPSCSGIPNYEILQNSGWNLNETDWISAYCSDPDSDTMTGYVLTENINEVDAKVNGTNNIFLWFYPYTSWTGSSTVGLYVRDSYEIASAEDTFTVNVLDATPPSIILNTPSNNSEIFAGKTIDLSVSDTNLDSVWYSNNSGTNNYSLDSPYDIDTTDYEVGKFDLYVWANDTNENVNEARFTFTIKSLPFTVDLIIGQGSAQVSNANYNLTYTLSDQPMVNLTSQNYNVQLGWSYYQD